MEIVENFMASGIIVDLAFILASTHNSSFSIDKHYPEYGNYRVYADSKDFMFYRLPSDSFYQAIDSLTLIENSGWRLEINNKYTYEKSLHWNIGMPFIEKYFYCDAYVFYLVIKIEKGNRFGHMHYRVCRDR